MPVCTCPNCGREIKLGWWLPRKTTCKECNEQFIVPYSTDPSYKSCNALAGFKIRINDFETAHPKLTKGVEVVGIAIAVAGAFYASTNEHRIDTFPPAAPPDELPEEQHSLLSLGVDTVPDVSLSTESLSEPENPAPVRREYSPRNPDDYESIIHSLGMIMVHLHDGWHPSQEKILKFKEKTGKDLPRNMTFRDPHDQRYQVKKK